MYITLSFVKRLFSNISTLAGSKKLKERLIIQKKFNARGKDRWLHIILADRGRKENV